MTHSSVLERDSSIRDDAALSTDVTSPAPAQRADQTALSHLTPWLDAARAGSSEAMGALWSTCRSYLLLVANATLGEDLRAKVGASDLVQDTFAQAQRGFADFEGHSQQELLAWLSRILENKLGTAVQKFRHTAKRDVRRERPLVPQAADSSDAWQLPVRDDSPSHCAAIAEERARVRAALGQLDESHRQVIVLRVWQQRTFDEIAAAMQHTVDAVRTLFVQAIAQLQTLLAPRGDDASFTR